MAHPKHIVTSAAKFDSVPGGLYLVLEPDFTIAEVSDRYLAVTHHAKDLMVGHNLLDFF